MIPRYNRPEIEKVWSNQNKFKIWTEIECSIAEQLSNLGKIPEQASIDISDYIMLCFFFYFFNFLNIKFSIRFYVY